MAADKLDISEHSDEDDEDYNVVLKRPTETQFAVSDQDSNASDAGAEDDSAHLPRRVLRSSGELSSISNKPELTRKPLPTRPKPTKEKLTARKKEDLSII